uniref:Alkyl transferase n=1 Tax=Saccoglossus kowalevskii TaxID=10224 RepID=A0ABM0GPC2_SACKO|nr:PREDICTED: dehydrodolichyl diphosphate synthase-like [Saccoglossus kowalevskii]
MSWFPEDEHRSTNRFTKFCANVLKCGAIPKHVAFIMDGNRRFARKSSLERQEGHIKGFEKLTETLEWCLDLGITEVTVYAFSIENFKRSKEEVSGLMELARQKFEKLLEEKKMIQKYGVCIRVLGDIDLLPNDVKRAVAEAVNFSKHNNRAILNVCFAYTSRHEISNAIKEMALGVEEGFLRPSDVSEELLEKCLYTGKSPNPELLIRTSGEVRLSDFLLWQTTFSVLSFVKVLWPEFSVWHLFAAVLHYQRNYEQIQKTKQQNQETVEERQRESDHQCVLEDYKNCSDLESKIQLYAKQREQRIQTFLNHLDEKHSKYLDSILGV